MVNKKNLTLFFSDWVYEEEVLGTNQAMYVSNDGKYLAYAQFNDTFVKLFYLINLKFIY